MHTIFESIYQEESSRVCNLNRFGPCRTIFTIAPSLTRAFSLRLRFASRQQPQERISASEYDIDWLKTQIEVNGLHMQDNLLRKGINPRTYAQQLQDLIQYKGISHYEQDEEAKNHRAFPCPGELLVEQHHSNYGEPWAGGRYVFEFLAESYHLIPESRVLEIGCGTLRVHGKAYT
ncbi:unnamed protein product [Lactuca virosa]|uniref:Uncharacterized protein n=1 Tax=Lactuca virosa TaxID=75947 RepID=A0AAU9M8Y9_9ASTR|nr:unnamed protein product [Lactuca virosa]